MATDFILELKAEQLKVVATNNVPNILLECVNWNDLELMQQKLTTLGKTENFEELNNVF